MRAVQWILSVSILIALAACQDPGLLLPGLGDTASRSLIGGVADGSVYQSGDTITQTISKASDPNQQPDSLVMRLSASDSIAAAASLSEQKFSGNQFGSGVLPPFTVPQLKPGLYRLDYLFYRGAAQIRQETVNFFVGYEKPAFQGIVAHPGTLVPNGDGVLELVMDATAFPNAHIRWSSGQQTIKSGLASAGALNLSIKAPPSEGVFTYVAEVFPRAPQGDDFSFKSPYAVENRVIVSNKHAGAASGLGPDADFSHLWHFQGNLGDSGRQNSGGNEIQLTMAGVSQFEQYKDVLGYVVGGKYKAKLPLFLLDGLNNDTPAFAVFLRLLPLHIQEGVIFRSRAQDGKSGLECRIAENDQLLVRLWGLGFDAVGRFDSPLRQGSETELQFCLSRKNGKIEILIVADAKIRYRASVAVDQSLVADPLSKLGDTELGNPAGPRFLLDEFGIYQPQIPSEDPFALAMRYRYGKALVFAQDFAANPSIEPLSGQGDLRLDGGSLVLSPASSLTLPPVDLNGGRAVFAIDFGTDRIDSNSTISLEGPELSKVSLVFGGQISQAGRSAPFLKQPDNPLRLSLEAKPGFYDISWGDQHFSALAGKAGKVILRINHRPADSSELRVRSVVGLVLSPSGASAEP